MNSLRIAFTFFILLTGSLTSFAQEDAPLVAGQPVTHDLQGDAVDQYVFLGSAGISYLVQVWVSDNHLVPCLKVISTATVSQENCSYSSGARVVVKAAADGPVIVRVSNNGFRSTPQMRYTLTLQQISGIASGIPHVDANRRVAAKSTLGAVHQYRVSGLERSQVLLYAFREDSHQVLIIDVYDEQSNRFIATHTSNDGPAYLQLVLPRSGEFSIIIGEAVGSTLIPMAYSFVWIPVTPPPGGRVLKNAEVATGATAGPGDAHQFLYNNAAKGGQINLKLASGTRSAKVCAAIVDPTGRVAADNWCYYNGGSLPVLLTGTYSIIVFEGGRVQTGNQLGGPFTYSLSIECSIKCGGDDIAIVPLTSVSVGQAGTPYLFTNHVATGGRPPYVWAVVEGNLPAGLTLAGFDGAISGTPTQAGRGDFIVSVRDADGREVRQPMSVDITLAPMVFRVVAASGVEFSQNGVTFYEKGYGGGGGRGISVMTVVNGTPNVITFDTYARGVTAFAELNNFMESISVGSLVFIAVGDTAAFDGSQTNPPDAVAQLIRQFEAMGANHVRRMAYRTSYILVGHKGTGIPIAESFGPYSPFSGWTEVAEEVRFDRIPAFDPDRLQVLNITDMTRPSDFRVGDRWEFQLAGSAANQKVWLRLWLNGYFAGVTNFGSTDGQGGFAINGTHESSARGSWAVQVVVGADRDADERSSIQYFTVR